MKSQKSFQTEQHSICVIYDMSEETRIKENARLREKALHDEASALKQAKNEGIEIGEVKKEAEIIAKMKAAGYSESEIQRILAL